MVIGVVWCVSCGVISVVKFCSGSNLWESILMKEEFRHKIICVDLDGTIISYKRGMCSEGKFGKVLPGAKNYLKRLMKDGWWVIIYTVRGNRNKISKALLFNGIRKGVHYSAVNRRKNVILGSYKGKCGADIYLDDRAICFKGNWKKTYNEIRKFKSWVEKRR